MNKRVIAVLACTLLALVAATVWVPVEPRGTWHPVANSTLDAELVWEAAPLIEFARIDRVLADAKVEPRTTEEVEMGDFPMKVGVLRPRWLMLAVEFVLIVGCGGLPALWLRARDRRRRADTVPVRPYSAD